MVFLTGPRQVGKTTLARSYREQWPNLYYLNFDAQEDKRIFVRKEWDRSSALVVMDEIHKWRGWKTHLKGVYDTEGIPPRILVTGSARLDLVRRGGDSLTGRYFLHRLHPLSVAELRKDLTPDEALDQLMTLGGFPEPFLAGSESRAKRWRKLYADRVVREDVRDMASISDLQALIVLVELLRERVGSPVSYGSLARDLQISPHTVKRWIEVLESLYILYRVVPYHRNIARAILKEPKIYFYDSGLVRGDGDAVLENIVANGLLKANHYLEDTVGSEVRLHYLRDKEKREVDFVIHADGRLTQLIEVKLSAGNVGRGLAYYRSRFPHAGAFQLVRSLKKARTTAGIQVVPAARYLARLPI